MNAIIIDMKVILATGDEIELLGPVVSKKPDGVFISHTDFRALIKGEETTVNAGSLANATFPTDAVQKADEDFAKHLPQVEEAWDRLRQLSKRK